MLGETVKKIKIAHKLRYHRMSATAWAVILIHGKNMCVDVDEVLG